MAMCGNRSCEACKSLRTFSFPHRSTLGCLRSLVVYTSPSAPNGASSSLGRGTMPHWRRCATPRNRAVAKLEAFSERLSLAAGRIQVLETLLRHKEASTLTSKTYEVALTLLGMLGGGRFYCRTRVCASRGTLSQFFVSCGLPSFPLSCLCSRLRCAVFERHLRRWYAKQACT